MIATGKKYRLQILNAILRMAPMAAKLLLALYMGRAFSLTDIGTYGLVLGTVTVLSVILGQDLIYVVSREIVGEDAVTVLRKMRDQAIHYGLNYLVLAVVIGVLIATHATSIPPRILVCTLILTILESLATITWFNMNSLHQQILANTMFCIRAGIWIIPVVILCMLNPGLRTADTVLIGWMIGAAASLLATLWCWRQYPWREAMARPIDWKWIKAGIKKGSPIWLGMMGLTGGTFVDRFVVEHFLTMDDVGVLTFYFSFTNALLTLMQSGVMAFASPRMIKHHRDGNAEDFHHEARQTSRQIALGAGIAAIGFGIAVPLFGFLSQREALIANTGTFWLMLLATWMRANSETFSNILAARHQDRAVWMGNLLFLIPALGGNLLLVPLLGFEGVGVSAIVASAFILLGAGGTHVLTFLPIAYDSNPLTFRGCMTMKIKLFFDGADIAQMKAAYTNPRVKGFTTNPTLMRKAGIADYEAFAREAIAAIPDRPISFEVFSDDFPTMEREARKIASWGGDTYVKIPVTNTQGESACPLIQKLSNDGIALNITAIMTLEQVKDIAAVISSRSRSIISVFAGRVADTGVDPVPMMAESVRVLAANSNAELLWASPRELLNMFQAEECGCHIITATKDIVDKMALIGKSLSEYSLDTVKMFYNDARAAAYKIV